MDFGQKNSVLHSSICRRKEPPGRSVKVKVIQWYYLHLSGVKKIKLNAWQIFLESSEKEGRAHKIMDFSKHVDTTWTELNNYYPYSITYVFQNWTDIIHIPLPVIIFQIHLALRTLPATLPAKSFAPTTPSCWPAHQGEATLWARWCGIVTTNAWTRPLPAAATRPSTSTRSQRCRRTTAWSTAVRWPIWWRRPHSPIASRWLCIVSSSEAKSIDFNHPSQGNSADY